MCVGLHPPGKVISWLYGYSFIITYFVGIINKTSVSTSKIFNENVHNILLQ